MASDANRVIAASAVISVGVGSINAVVRYGRPPSARFIIGSGIAYLVLSALAEGEPEIAKAFAMAIATTVVLGEGDGLFAYVNRYGEADTKPGAQDPKAAAVVADPPLHRNIGAVALPDPYPPQRSDTLTPQPGLR